MESMKCNVEILQLLARRLQEAGDLAPSVEDVLGKITQLDHAKDLMSKDLKDHRMNRDAAQKELDELNAEKSRLEELLGEKRETLCVLRLQCDKKGSEKLRRQQMSDGRNHRIQDLTANIQGEKDKQRKQRMEFERQLEELSEKHKALWELHNEKRLALEISGMEDRKVQLRNEEREEHRKLTEMLHATGTEGPARTADSSFRLSAEAAVKQFEEENMRARSRQAAASVYQSCVQERLRRATDAAGIDLRDGDPAETSCLTGFVSPAGASNKEPPRPSGDSMPRSSSGGQKS